MTDLVNVYDFYVQGHAQRNSAFTFYVKETAENVDKAIGPVIAAMAQALNAPDDEIIIDNVTVLA